MLSLLYKKPAEAPVHIHEEAFEDLLIDDFVNSVLGKEELRKLAGDWYYKPIRDTENLRYRQEVFEDLFRTPTLRKVLGTFVEKIDEVERLLKLSRNLHYEDNRKGWYLEASFVYCKALEELNNSLSSLELKSLALNSFRKFVDSYVRSQHFRTLKADSESVKKELSEIRFVMVLEPGQFTVTLPEGEVEYAAQVENVFGRFNLEGCGQGSLFEVRKSLGMNHIEARIVEFVRKLYPDNLEPLDEFFRKHGNFLATEFMTLRRELIFYLAYYDYIEPLRETGLPFCIPKLKVDDRSEMVYGVFDLLLAQKRHGRNIVLNDVKVGRDEKIFIVTGPNQGGKTTYARTYAFIHYLAALGLPVPGTRAELFIPDRIYTHFEREEKVENELSKLEHDILRLKSGLANISRESLVVLNEIFSSAALIDSVRLSEMLLDELLERGCVVVWVTFIDVLARIDDRRVVSLVALISEEDPTIRTFKVVRKKPGIKAYAASLAEKYGLTYEIIKERLTGGSRND